MHSDTVFYSNIHLLTHSPLKIVLKKLFEATILDKIEWNSKPPSPPPPQIKDEAARRAKTRHFPILDLGGRGGLGFPFILSKIEAEPFSAVYLEKKTVVPKPSLELLLMTAHEVQGNLGST